VAGVDVEAAHEDPSIDALGHDGTKRRRGVELAVDYGS